MNSQNIPKNAPSHVGIIMDGNGRWAKQKMLDRSQGHLNGIQAVKDSLTVALSYGVQYVSLYVFSTENWKRPKHEVKVILDTVSGNLREHYPFYRAHNIRVVHSGNNTQLPQKALDELSTVKEETKNNTGLVLNLAFNYGGRDEIIRAVQKHALAQEKDPQTPALDIENFSNYLDNHMPDLDLMIRTGAESRISNFLLWQIAYAELYFSEVLWPNWNQDNMKTALDYYASKQRRFGGL